MVSRTAHKWRPFGQFHQEVQSSASRRLMMSSAGWQDEAQQVSWLLNQIRHVANWSDDTAKKAQQLIEGIRRQKAHTSGVDALMREFSLSSEEGIALMCLAEALLRIPDRQTADRLIADKVSKGAWRSHLGGASSVFVNVATWGLLMTGKIVGQKQKKGMTSVLTKLISKGGEPLIRKSMDIAMRMLGNQFVKGQHMAEALSNSIAFEKKGYRYSYDMLGEAALTEKDAAQYCQAYEDAIHAVGQASKGRGIYNGPGISVKLSALHPRYTYTQRSQVLAELLPRLKQLVLLAKQYDIGINIDAEESDRLSLSLDLMDALVADPDLAGFDGLGFVVQAYQKRCPYVIDHLVAQARLHQRKLMIRLVKGAYWDTEIKRAQVLGLSEYPVYTRKVYTDVSYLYCAQKLLSVTDVIYPQFATHNAHTMSAIWYWARANHITQYEFQCLHGMGEPLYDQLIGLPEFAQPCRIYAPVGTHRTLLPYLVRRLLENGANSSFVNRVADISVNIEELTADPIALARQYQGLPHPHIPLPADLYGEERVNAAGLDLSDDKTLRWLDTMLKPFHQKQWHAKPLLAVTLASAQDAEVTRQILNPAHHQDIVGTVTETDPRAVSDAFAEARRAVRSWQQRAAYRVKLLRTAASLFEIHLPELIALMVREAGKTIPDALAEVREAVDFLRYYSMQIAHQPHHENNALGPVVCISPWNFPLAIFVGQMSAALAAGNTVLAKPAQQTPLTAYRAVELLHEAGIPVQVLQYLPGQGRMLGDMLTGHPYVQGVVFTGSTQVARHIAQRLAVHLQESHHDIALIAETGGQNAMIVDSSALPEQVVQDVLMSAFNSAGQRCSALRILCVQEDIADKVMTMLWGAMQELNIGMPDQLSTDIGPVIDHAAQQHLLEHIEQMRQQGHRISQLSSGSECAAGTFVPPTLIEISALHQVREEVFGPVLHVLRFHRNQLKQLVSDINHTGYGLTLGIHSRIDDTIDYVTAHAQVGNIYVNRNMVGAVVGVQPFGGEGLSGTGPKAGGPLYLARLQRSVMPALPADEQMLPDTLLQILLEWAGKTGHDRLIKLAAYYQQHGLLHHTLYLSGPTGEENTLSFLPKGKIGCVATNKSVFFNQLVAVLVTGNLPVVQMNMVSHIVASLPGKVRSAIQETDCMAVTDLKSMLVEASLTDKWAIPLSEREGALVPMIPVSNDAPIPLWRLMTERVVSVNTTALGGNTSLMTMSS